MTIQVAVIAILIGITKILYAIFKIDEKHKVAQVIMFIIGFFIIGCGIAIILINKKSI